ncbi:MAG: hypothetical protein R8G34_13435 [Paracoccaceae bacterium]|nr:hypothetical protein [Paracoccaceae bacterium]
MDLGQIAEVPAMILLGETDRAGQMFEQMVAAKPVHYWTFDFRQGQINANLCEENIDDFKYYERTKVYFIARKAHQNDISDFTVVDYTILHILFQ